MAIFEPVDPPDGSAMVPDPVAEPADSVAALPARYPSSVDPAAVKAIAGGYHSAPFDILGMHSSAGAGAPSIVIRTFQPQAFAVSVLRREGSYPMRRVHPDGLFEAVFDRDAEF